MEWMEKQEVKEGKENRREAGIKKKKKGRMEGEKKQIGSKE